MPSPPRRHLDPAWAVCLQVAVLGMLFLAVPLYNAATRPDCQRNKDYTFWWELGQDVRADRPIYAPLPNGELKYLYPPPLVVLLYAPLTHLGPVGLVLGLGALTTAAWVASLWASLVLLTGQWRGHPRWIYAVPSLAITPYMWDIQLLGQINMVLLSLVLLSVVALRRKYKVGAAALFAAPVAMKAFPLPAIVYFLARREWKVAGLSLAFIVAYLFVAPGLVRGFERNARELGTWADKMIGNQSGEGIAARPGIGFTRRNHSLISVSHRLLRDVDAGDDWRHRFTVNVANVSPLTAQRIGMVACLALGAVLLVATRLKFATSPLAEGIEVSMVCILVLLCSPLSHTYFFCWLLPAWTAVAVMWQDRTVRYGVIAAGVMLASAFTEQFDPTLQALGATTWGSVTLFLTLAYARFKLPNAAAMEAPLRLAA